MSAKQSKQFPLLWLIFPIGLVLYLAYNLTKATPKESLWIKLSKYSRYADWIEAQARHESANYTSAVFKRSNNPFGMKNAIKRKQLGKQVGSDPYRHYANIGESIRDYLLYLDEFKTPTNIASAESYYMKLEEQGYASDPKYTNKILRYVKGRVI